MTDATPDPDLSTPGALLVAIVDAIGISREDFLSMPPADVVGAASSIKHQADHLAGVLEEAAKDRYRGDVALATLSGLVDEILPLMQGIETPEQKAEAGLLFSRVHQALAESRRTDGDQLDPDEAIRRVGRLVRMDPPDPERSPDLYAAFELLGQEVEITLAHDDPAAVAKGTLLGFCDAGQAVVRGEDGFISFCWPMLAVRAVDGDPGGE